MTLSPSTMSLEAFANPATGGLVESAIRTIAYFHDPSPGEYAEKYGATMDCELFSMHRYCWCEEESCGWCSLDPAPNFHYKPTDLRVWWYKYIGRGMLFSREPKPQEVAEMLSACLNPAYSPTPSA